MKFTVREVQFEDEAPIIIALDSEFFDPVDAPFPGGKGYWWLARNESGDVVGYANLRQSHKWSDCGFLARAAVIESARGNRLHQRLIAVRSAKAKRLGWNYLITNTYRNPKSVNTLIRCGFKSYIPAYKWATSDAQYWRRKV